MKRDTLVLYIVRSESYTEKDLGRQVRAVVTEALRRLKVERDFNKEIRTLAYGGYSSEFFGTITKYEIPLVKVDNLLWNRIKVVYFDPTFHYDGKFLRFVLGTLLGKIKRVVNKNLNANGMVLEQKLKEAWGENSSKFNPGLGATVIDSKELPPFIYDAFSAIIPFFIGNNTCIIDQHDQEHKHGVGHVCSVLFTNREVKEAPCKT